MTTTYELYTNENGTPKAVEGKAPAIIERVEALETEVTQGLAGKAPMSHTHTVSQITDMPNIVLSVNDVTPDDSGNVSINVGVKTVEGRTPDGTGNVSLGLHAVATSGNYNDLTNKPSIPATPSAYIVQTWSSGTSWYRKYSDGWIEQGGRVQDSGNWYDRTKTITLNTAFKDTNYNITLGDVYNLEDPNYTGSNVSTVTSVSTNKFNVYLDDYTGGVYWHACGF